MISEVTHVDYPHEPGRLYDCPACESRCHCTVGYAECIFDGPHSGAARGEFVSAGETVTVELPYSEVCLHMRVAGKVMQVKFLGGQSGAQLVGDDGRNFSGPITAGEAGFYVLNGDYAGGQWYYYPPAGLASCGHPANADGECDCSAWPERASYPREDAESPWLGDVDRRADDDVEFCDESDYLS